MRANEFITEGVAGPKKCWPGHRKVGTQPGTGKNKGKRVNDCEKIKKKGVAESAPNFEREWDEAIRYPEFANLGKEAWIKLANNGKLITVTRKTVNKINNTDAADPKSFKLLDPEKQKRALAQLATGDVEMPIVARYSDGYLELIGGNTRLTAQMAKDGQAKVWLFNVPEELQQGVAEGSLKEFYRDPDGDDESPLDNYPCYDCGSTIYMHHTKLCDLAEDDAILDLPLRTPGLQHWSGEIPKGLKPIPGLQESFNGEYDDEAGMAEGNLHTLSRAVNGLLDTIDDNDNLPEWCQEKIAKAEMMLVSVWDYLQSQKERGIDPSISERLTPDQMFDIIEEMVENAAAEHGVDPELIWEEFESVDDVELFESAAWRRKEGKSKKGGLNAKGVASYRRENPGSKLQTAVTTKPSKLKKGSKAAKRRKSFCARMGGVKGPMKKPNGKPTRKALALRKWNC